MMWSFFLELPGMDVLPKYCAQCCSSTSDLGIESGIPTLSMSPGTAPAAFLTFRLEVGGAGGGGRAPGGGGRAPAW